MSLRTIPTRARVAGLDEVGRGALAGPLVVAGVVVAAGLPWLGRVGDSKDLSPAQRAAIWRAAVSRDDALDRVPAPDTTECFVLETVAELRCAIAVISPAEVMRANILGAVMDGVCACLGRLSPVDLALVDGNRVPADPPVSCRAVVGGDRIETSIALAACLAKHLRDQWMIALAAGCPGYGWEQNKGYGSAFHRAAIEEQGATPWHRRHRDGRLWGRG